MQMMMMQQQQQPLAQGQAPQGFPYPNPNPSTIFGSIPTPLDPSTIQVRSSANSKADKEQEEDDGQIRRSQRLNQG
jgi:hypothetical protein